MSLIERLEEFVEKVKSGDKDLLAELDKEYEEYLRNKEKDMTKIEFFYTGQMRNARKWLIDNNIIKADEIALMTDGQIEYQIEKYVNDNDMQIVHHPDGEAIGIVPKGTIIWFER